MGSLALLARELGWSVSGSDANVYPPMSTQLAEQGIELDEGYDAEFLSAQPDLVLVGNAMSRGNPAIEALLESEIKYCSGPEWLRENVLRGRWVLAVAGTHGKTTTTSMLAKILDYAGLEPGFLIGGIPQDFGISARLGSGKFFVIEADEYDSAFFDKRSKFVHYLPRTLIMNNLEFDHADIFADLAAIQTQFHHVVRTVPATGRVILPAGVEALEGVLAQGCWSDTERIVQGEDNGYERWQYRVSEQDGQTLDLVDSVHGLKAQLQWHQSGEHNAANAMSAIAAAEHVGVSIKQSVEALEEFIGVKRRMELLCEHGGVQVFDDFAHHPTAIRLTLEGQRRKTPGGRIIAVIEPRSNTMRMGGHAHALKDSVSSADQVIWYHAPALDWNPDFLRQNAPNQVNVMRDTKEIIAHLLQQRQNGDVIVLMSNGGFNGIHSELVAALKAQ